MTEGKDDPVKLASSGSGRGERPRKAGQRLTNYVTEGGSPLIPNRLSGAAGAAIRRSAGLHDSSFSFKVLS